MILRIPETRVLVGANYMQAAQSLIRGGYAKAVQDLAPNIANHCRVLLLPGVDMDALAQNLERSWRVTMEADSVLNYGMPPAEWA